MAEPPPTPPTVTGEPGTSATPSSKPNMAQQDSDLTPPAATDDICTSANQEGADRLPELVQSLPAELFNDILEYTLTPNTPGDVVIDKHYRPPIHLQIDRKSREQFAAKYYRTTTFVTTHRMSSELKKWLRSLSRPHAGEVSHVHLHTAPNDQPSHPWGQITKCMDSLAYLKSELRGVKCDFRASLVDTSLDLTLDTVDRLDTMKITISYWPCQNGVFGAEITLTREGLRNQALNEYLQQRNSDAGVRKADEPDSREA